MEVGVAALLFGVLGTFGHAGLNFGLYRVIAKEVVLRMDVLFLEQVRMIVFGLLIVIVVEIFIEHKKKH